MIGVIFLHGQKEWKRLCERVPAKGDAITFTHLLDIDAVDYEVTVVHWFQDEFWTNRLVPYVSLRRING